MKPAWDELAEEFQDSLTVLIADVDCTSNEAKTLCEENDVKGFPTIKYFTPDMGKDGSTYSGGRTYEELKKFVDDYLHAECDVKNPSDACTDREQSYIAKTKGKGTASWEKEVKRLKGLTDQASSMKPDKHRWLLQRIEILNQFLGRKTAKSRKWYAKYGWRSVIVLVSTLAVIVISTMMVVRSRGNKPIHGTTKGKRAKSVAEESAERIGEAAAKPAEAKGDPAEEATHKEPPTEQSD